jgi:hypothetical protein
VSQGDVTPIRERTSVALVHPESGATVNVDAEWVVATLAARVTELQEVIGRLLYRAGPITPDTPCRCGATQPAHACGYHDQAERDALALMPDA